MTCQVLELSLRSRRIKRRGWGEGREFGGIKRRSGRGGGTPAIKTPVGSILRSLGAAKF